MENRNASASAFGWDFQANAAILLMLENIQEAEKVRVEGKDEDIEITLADKTKIYSQVKAVIKPDDYSHVIAKLTAALETMNQAASNGDGCLYTYITNSPNPFNMIMNIPFGTYMENFPDEKNGLWGVLKIVYPGAVDIDSIKEKYSNVERKYVRD